MANNNTDLIHLLNKYKINKDIFIVKIPLKINYYDSNNIFGNIDISDLKCPICLNILKNPICCSSKKKAHFFCKECINKYLFGKDYCPICKKYFEYITQNEINKYLYKLCFRCIYFNLGCNKVIRYLEYFKHINNCKYKKDLYECNVEKYNYNTKTFDICGFKGNIKEVENHFISCAFDIYKCLFCKKDIIKIKLKDHVQNKCKVKFIYYDEEGRYIGECKNNERNGYGIFFSPDFKYEGQWKKDKKNGFGISITSSGKRYHHFPFFQKSLLF